MTATRSALVSGICLAVLVGGCGSSDDTTEKQTATTTAATTAATQATTAATPAPPAIDNAAVKRMGADTAGSDAHTLPALQPTDARFLRAAFDSAQSMWQRKFAAAGTPYEPAHLILFHTQVHTPCGVQGARTGPFYCPAAKGVYLNTDFFDALAREYGFSSPFAAGYVTAHEVAHHVQLLLGVHTRVAQANASDPGGMSRRSIAVELQADCYAGVWLHNVARAGQLSQADVADIIRSATVVGDDYQRNKAGAELAPETWTHGSSEQRVHWLSVGLQSGSPADCDTFSEAPIRRRDVQSRHPARARDRCAGRARPQHLRAHGPARPAEQRPDAGVADRRAERPRHDRRPGRDRGDARAPACLPRAARARDVGAHEPVAG